ncbi:MAG TPA: 50S ribosomal protein L3 [Candidatus Paceibacterota bacterium]
MKLIGVKKAMTQIFDDQGVVRSGTVVALEAKLPIGSLASNKLAIGDRVTVSGISKGKGFQGVVKRHGFHGGSRTHGQKHSEREPGAIGGGGGRAGGRVAKGIRMAGRMGGDRVTVSNLSVISLDEKKGEVIVSGAIPGRRGTRIEIKKVQS